MSAGVDVLAVMDIAATAVENQGGNVAILREVIANVSELIDAASAFKGKRGAFMALGAADPRTIRLWAALARLRGEA